MGLVWRHGTAIPARGHTVGAGTRGRSLVRPSRGLRGCALCPASGRDRDSGTVGQRDRGTAGEWDGGTAGQRDGGTAGERGPGRGPTRTVAGGEVAEVERGFAAVDAEQQLGGVGHLGRQRVREQVHLQQRLQKVPQHAGPARSGRDRHGTAGPGTTRLSRTQHGSALLGPARLGPALPDPARHGPARLGTERPDPAQTSPAQLGTAQPAAPPPVPAGRGARPERCETGGAERGGVRGGGWGVGGRRGKITFRVEVKGWGGTFLYEGNLGMGAEGLRGKGMRWGGPKWGGIWEWGGAADEILACPE